MTVKRLPWRRINVTLIKNIEPRIWYRKYMYFFERTKLSEYIIILDCSSYNDFTYLFNEVSEWSKLMLLSCDSQQWKIQPVHKYFWEIFRQFCSVLRKNNLVWEKAILNCRVVKCYRSSEEGRAILARVSISSVCFLLSSVEVPSHFFSHRWAFEDIISWRTDDFILFYLTKEKSMILRYLNPMA